MDRERDGRNAEEMNRSGDSARTGNSDTLFGADEDRLPEVYALIWQAHQTESEFDPNEFSSRIPRLMDWLRDLKERGHLVACGGGAFEERGGGLTIVRASSPEEAVELGSGSPMNEIGITTVMIWDVFYGDLVARKHEGILDRPKPAAETASDEMIVDFPTDTPGGELTATEGE